MRFKVGDRVKYISGKHGDYNVNPLWGGKYGKIEGVVIKTADYSTLPIRVSWDNGGKNTYYERDLELTVQEWDE